MIPGINPKQMQQAMKKMGMKQEEIDATEVIIRTKEFDIVIKTPEVLKINMMGQESFQITGTPEIIENIESINQEDIKTVMEQADVSEEQAKEALEKHNGDLAEAILSLQDTQ